MANRRLIVEIIGDSRSLERSFARSTQSAQRFKVGIGTIFKGAVGFLAVQKGAELAGDAIRAGIDEFSEASRVAAQTNAVLKSTGRVANVTAKQVDRLSESLADMSGIDDELIQQGANLLLTFKNVRNEVGKGNAIFDRATAAALDLSVAGFGSVETTAKQLGKALNDPVRGMTALRRAGITFTKSQEDAVKSMVKTNDILGAQRLILREVESQVGGSARALGDTLPGKLNILRNTFNNLAGSIIERFEPAIKRTVDRVVDWLAQSKNQQRVQKAINDTVKTAAAVVKVLVQAFRALKAILDPVIAAVGGLENAIKLLLAVMVASKIASFATAIGLVGRSAATSTASLGLLRAALTRLALISAIAIPITVFLNRKAITREFDKITDSLPKWARGEEVAIPINQQTLAQLRKTREQFQGMGGDSEKVLAAIDARIRQLTKAAAAARKAGATTGSVLGPGGIADPRTRDNRTTSAVTTAAVVESHITVTLDGDVVGRAVTRSQQKTRRRNPPQKRGPNTGVL